MVDTSLHQHAVASGASQSFGQFAVLFPPHSSAVSSVVNAGSRECGARRGVVPAAAAAAAATAAVFGRELLLLPSAFCTPAKAGTVLSAAQEPPARARGSRHRHGPVVSLGEVQASSGSSAEALLVPAAASEASTLLYAVRGGAAVATVVALVSKRRWRFWRRHLSRVRCAAAGPFDGQTAPASEPGLLPPSVSPPVAMHDKDDPGITAANEVIQNRLLAEPQYQAVLNLVERHLDKFSIVNMVTALHMCAKTAQSDEFLKRQIIADPNFVTLFHETRGRVMEKVSEIAPRTLGSFMWGCAHLSIFDNELFSEVTSDASRRLHMYSAHGIALVVFALGVLQQPPRQRFIQALVREFRTRIHTEFDPRSVVMVVYGMMRLGIKDERLMRAASEAMKRSNLDNWEPLSVTCMAYAYTKLEYRDDAAYALMGKKTLEHLNSLTPHQISMAAMSFAKVSDEVEGSSYAMDSIQRGVVDRLDEFSNRDLTTYCFAVGKYRQLTTVVDVMKGVQLNDDDPIAKDILEQVDKRGIDSFSMAELNLINYSLMRLAFRKEDFLNEAAAQFIKRAQELTSVELVNCMYAFARLQYVHVQFILAMLEEVKRRNMLEEMETVEWATLAYSLAACRVRDDELMEKIAAMCCERVREMEPQAVAMVVWSMAVTNTRANAEALISAVAEDMARRTRDYHPVSIACCMWGCAILGRSHAAALSQLSVFFSKDFWTNSWDSPGYAMMYYALTALHAEKGLQMQEVGGWFACRRIYEELTGVHMGIQNSRLSERLRIHGIPHQANAMVPTLEGFRNAGVRADIVLEKLNLIIEVEGPQRMTVPLKKIAEEIEDKDLIGRPDEVTAEARSAIECSLTGSASWKRRLLRKCGWKVVTLSFDENEEYIADALDKMVAKEKDKMEVKQSADGEAAAAAEPGEAMPAASSQEPQEPISPETMASPFDRGLFGDATLDSPGFTDDRELSDYEVRLRKRHETACRELKRRIEEERGNAAATERYKSYLEYRNWQAAVERQVLDEMLASL